MTAAMVDRLFWRAGFGPSDADRKRWTGRTLGAAVDWLLNTPAAYSGSPGTDQGKPLDPTGNDDDLVLSWVDQMNRAINPFVERMTFFWHGHWANSRESVSPPQLLMTQTEAVPQVRGLREQSQGDFPRYGVRGHDRSVDAPLPDRGAQRTRRAERELCP